MLTATIQEEIQIILQEEQEKKTNLIKDRNILPTHAENLFYLTGSLILRCQNLENEFNTNIQKGKIELIKQTECSVH